MPAKWTILDGIIYTELSGEVNYDMIMKYIDFISSLKGKIVNRYELHDHTNTTNINLSADDIRNIAEYSMKNNDIFDQFFLAIYAPNDLTFGMARMFESFYEIKNRKINSQIFRDKEDAIQFLKNKMSEYG